MKTILSFSLMLVSSFVFSQMSNIEQIDINSDEPNNSSGIQHDGPQKLTDVRDGNEYKTFKIEGNVWMTENLNFDTEGSFSYNDFDGNSKKFGRLYTWEAAQNVCPDGWHLPSDEEWDALTESLGGMEKAGIKFMSLKDNDITKSIFGGWRSNNANYYFIADKGYYWTSTTQSDGFAWYRYIQYTDTYMFRAYHKKEMAFSVRCVQN